MSTSFSTLGCAFCLLITTIAIPLNRLSKDSVQNVGGPLSQTVSSTFSISSSVNSDTTGPGTNPVCIPPPQFNPMTTPPPGGIQLSKRVMPALSSDDANGPSHVNCFNPPASPIPILAHCVVAVNIMLHEAPPAARETWIGRREWSHHGCSLLLVPRFPFTQDVFTRAEIAQTAMAIERTCFHAMYGFRGGFELIGSRNFFSVVLLST